MGIGLRVKQVVDRNDFKFTGVPLGNRLQNLAANPAKPIDTDLCSHRKSSS
jgi:hypothetical protein